MAKLSDTQSILLTTASTRADLSVLPAPDTIKVRGAALTRTLAALLRRGLIEEGAAESSNTSGGDTGNGIEPNALRDLRITEAGLATIGVDHFAMGNRNGRTKAVPADAERAELQPARPGGKLGLLLESVARPAGATLDELASKSGWLPHTTRAAITRLRQRGYDIQLATVGDRRSYRLDVTA